VSFAAITLFVASQRVFVVVISLSTQAGNFWTHPCIHPCIRRTNRSDSRKLRKNDAEDEPTQCVPAAFSSGVNQLKSVIRGEVLTF
jgi:hypothetical protein